jgi:hypothetical protein
MNGVDFFFHVKHHHNASKVPIGKMLVRLNSDCIICFGAS